MDGKKEVIGCEEVSNVVKDEVGPAQAIISNEIKCLSKGRKR